LNFEKKAKIPSAKNIILHWNVPEKIMSQNKNSFQKLKNSFSKIDQRTLEESTEIKFFEDNSIKKE
jgi:hypothetical protein